MPNNDKDGLANYDQEKKDIMNVKNIGVYHFETVTPNGLDSGVKTKGEIKIKSDTVSSSGISELLLTDEKNAKGSALKGGQDRAIKEF